MALPRFIRTQSAPDQEGRRRLEWLVRGLSEEMTTEHGVKIKTPEDLLNRYYRSDSSIPVWQSILSTSASLFLRYEDIVKDEFFLEYS